MQPGTDTRLKTLKETHGITGFDSCPQLEEIRGIFEPPRAASNNLGQN